VAVTEVQQKDAGREGATWDLVYWRAMWTTCNRSCCYPV